MTPHTRPLAHRRPTTPAQDRFVHGMDVARRPTGPLLALLVVLLAFGVGRGVAWPLSILLFGPDGPDTATLAGQTFNNIVPFAGTLAALTLWVVLKERRRFSTLGFQAPPRTALFGLLVGALMIGGLILIEVASGQMIVQLQPVNGALIAGLLLALVGFIVQGSTEDILFRGYLTQAATRRWGLLIAVAFQALIFALIHSINPGGFAVLPLINLFLFAVFLGAWSLKEGGLWVACAWHAMWNWAQGNIAGVQVSGEQIDTSLLKTTPLPGSNDLITGGGFGLEGSILATGVLLTGIMIVLLTHRARRRTVHAV